MALRAGFPCDGTWSFLFFSFNRSTLLWLPPDWGFVRFHLGLLGASTDFTGAYLRPHPSLLLGTWLPECTPADPLSALALGHRETILPPVPSLCELIHSTINFFIHFIISVNSPMQFLREFIHLGYYLSPNLLHWPCTRHPFGHLTVTVLKLITVVCNNDNMPTGNLLYYICSKLPAYYFWTLLYTTSITYIHYMLNTLNVAILCVGGHGAQRFYSTWRSQ